MKKMITSLLSILLVISSLEAEICVKGRVEAAPLYMHIRTILSGRTNNKVDLYGGRGDATILPFKDLGVCLKPFVFGGTGGDSDIFSYGCGLGHYTPVGEKFILVPFVGVSRTRFNSPLVLPAPFGSIKQKFRSVSFYAGSELVYKFRPCFYITGIYQYGWAHTITDTDAVPEIGITGRSKGHSQGSNYAILCDYYFQECVSLSAAFGYNSSLSKERHGLKGYGIKVGAAYMF